jgi:hypothetical protein
MKIIVAILAISLILNLVGLVIVYKYLKSKRHADRITRSLIQSREEYNRRFSGHLLFIHHSVGQNWLYEGGLKDSLEKLGIGVHSATYGSDIGQDTDMADWVPKFNDKFAKMLKYDTMPDILYPDDTENKIIMFKPCFPNSNITGEGDPPGNPHSEEMTVWNYKSVFENLAQRFSGKPEILFIYVTAPPLVPNETTEENAGRAREFNNWVKNEFAAEYKNRTGLNNFLVFDLFDVLADSGDCLKSEYRRSETNSHPDAEGSKAATMRFMQFLRENGLVDKGGGISDHLE